MDIIEGMVEKLLVKEQQNRGIELEDGKQIFCDALILTTGTYLKSKILIGDQTKEEGLMVKEVQNF